LTSPSRESGTVIEWKAEKGHGRIQADSGAVVWAHFSQIIGDGFRALSVGQRIQFTRVEAPGPNGTRPEAHQITAI
jgi:CspA family cold shock protein